MATPTPSPAEPAAPVPAPMPPSGLALGTAADPKAPPQRDSRMDFLPEGSLDARFDRSGETLSGVQAGAGAVDSGYSGIKVDGLEGGPLRARGSISDGAPIGLLVGIALLLGWLIWRFLFASGRVNFAGHDGNR